jgi:hypothetical protein
VIDLPGEASARVGVGFVECGFRPVPLYNAVPAALGVVNLYPIMAALCDGAERVAAAPSGAPPAFLLDADRMSGGRLVTPGAFDNRSMCRESDFPSARTLSEAGIRRVLLIRTTDERPADDLEEILVSWQRRGMALWRKRAEATSAAAPFTLKRRGLLAQFVEEIRRSSLHRRPDDAFGRLVPGAG